MYYDHHISYICIGTFDLTEFIVKFMVKLEQALAAAG